MRPVTFTSMVKWFQFQLEKRSKERRDVWERERCTPNFTLFWVKFCPVKLTFVCPCSRSGHGYIFIFVFHQRDRATLSGISFIHQCLRRTQARAMRGISGWAVGSQAAGVLQCLLGRHTASWHITTEHNGKQTRVTFSPLLSPDSHRWRSGITAAVSPSQLYTHTNKSLINMATHGYRPGSFSQADLASSFL